MFSWLALSWAQVFIINTTIKQFSKAVHFRIKIDVEMRRLPKWKFVFVRSSRNSFYTIYYYYYYSLRGCHQWGCPLLDVGADDNLTWFLFMNQQLCYSRQNTIFSIKIILLLLWNQIVIFEFMRFGSFENHHLVMLSMPRGSSRSSR